MSFGKLKESKLKRENFNSIVNLFSRFQFLRYSLPVFVYYLLNYIIVIYLKNKIGYENYGKIGVALGYSAFFQTFVLLGQNSGVEVSTINQFDWIKFLRNSIRIGFIMFILLSLFIVVLNEEPYLFLIGLAHSIPFLLSGMYKSKLAADGNSLLFSRFQYYSILCSFLLTFLVYTVVDNYAARILILLVTDLGVLIVLFRADLARSLQGIFKFDNIEIYPNYRFYMFATLNALLSFFYTYFDRMYLADVVSYSESGKFWFWVQISMPVLVLGEIVVRWKSNYIYSDKIFGALSRINRVFFISFFLFLLTGSIFLSYKGDLISYIFSGQIANSLYLPLSAMLIGRKRMLQIFLLTLAVAAFQVFLYVRIRPSSIEEVALIFFYIGIFRLLLYGVFITKLVKYVQ
jgi:hypothetical protein